MSTPDDDIQPRWAGDVGGRLNRDEADAAPRGHVIFTMGGTTDHNDYIGPHIYAHPSEEAPFPESEIDGDIVAVTVKSYGDEPAGAYVEVVGVTYGAVVAMWNRTVRRYRSPWAGGGRTMTDAVTSRDGIPSAADHADEARATSANPSTMDQIHAVAHAVLALAAVGERQAAALERIAVATERGVDRHADALERIADTIEEANR